MSAGVSAGGIKGWRARIRVEGKQETLGHFDTPEEAARAYDRYVSSVGWLDDC